MDMRSEVKYLATVDRDEPDKQNDSKRAMRTKDHINIVFLNSGKIACA